MAVVYDVCNDRLEIVPMFLVVGKKRKLFALLNVHLNTRRVMRYIGPF